jgi:aromatic-L-amino-acid decarboxylase
VLSAVCFRHRGVDNRALVTALQADARIYLAGASVGGVDCLRACFVNFRTTDEDVHATVEVVKDVARRYAATGQMPMATRRHPDR